VGQLTTQVSQRDSRRQGHEADKTQREQEGAHLQEEKRDRQNELQK